ncbi:uncharacterized protein BYT42DRAFT_566105 [Radiomyces spectabilis]|uniref:uncharacterized protein n=1 Tax=Radiomyces spectabilis TaxID=64574 RepID=UPI00221F5FCE|nr:uncharacterized protein BYT42DRAFT_566105 [Radiomyces spectabilis]KAI8381319.1 hypothetical protein BYT42DRAFT_566105 [Radiomyces spectabilis]
MYSAGGMNLPSSSPSKGIRFSFITPTDQARFEEQFVRLAGPTGGNKIYAQNVKAFFGGLNLDNESLAKIWDLSSLANAPYLTFPEFALFMFLTSAKLSGKAIPSSLPSSVKEEVQVAIATLNSTENNASQMSGFGAPQVQMPMMTGMPQQMPAMTGMSNLQPQMPMQTGMGYNARPTSPLPYQQSMQTGFAGAAPYQTAMTTGIGRPLAPQMNNKPRIDNTDFSQKMMPNQSGATNLLIPSLGTQPNEKISWKISPEEKQRYREIFYAWETSGSGYMTGDVARNVLTQSGLQQSDLMKIWSLADRDNKGSLDVDEFAIAMHLIYRKLNNFEIPAVLPSELAPPSNVLKKYISGHRGPPPFGSPSPTQSPAGTPELRDRDEGRGGYVSNARRAVSNRYGAAPRSRYTRDDSDEESGDQDQEDGALDELRQEIAHMKRTLEQVESSSGRNKGSQYRSTSSKYSLEELKEKIRKAQQELRQAMRSNPSAYKVQENDDTLLDLLETQKSLQEEIQYLCNRDIPVLARQLRTAAAELRDAKVRRSKKQDGAQDFMAFIQPTGPGGAITESDRVRAKAKAMMAARKAGNSVNSSDSAFDLRRAEQEKQEYDQQADRYEREMERSREALRDLRGDLQFLASLQTSKATEDKKRFEKDRHDMAYDLRRFLEQLERDQYITEPITPSYTERQSVSSSPSMSGSRSIPSSTSQTNLTANKPNTSSPAASPSRPRTAEEIKKEAERRVQERLAALHAKRNPSVRSPTAENKTTPAKPHVNEEEVTAQQRLREAERQAQDRLRDTERQRQEAERQAQNSEADRQRAERLRQEEQVAEQERLRLEEERERQQRVDEERDLEERRKAVLAKEEEARLARMKAIQEAEDAENAARQSSNEAPSAPSTPSEAPAPVPTTSSASSPPPPPPPPPAPPVATPSTETATATTSPAAKMSSNNPFAKLQGGGQSEAAASAPAMPTGARMEKPDAKEDDKEEESAAAAAPVNNKRVSYNPFAAFSAFSATKARAQGDSESEDDDGWDVLHHDDSDDEVEFPAAGSAKNLAGLLFDAINQRQQSPTMSSRGVSPKPAFATPPESPAAGSATAATPTPPPPPPAPPAPSAPSAESGGVPPPPAPPAPAPAPASMPAPSTAASGTPNRNALLSQIQQGTRLKKAVTNDRSQPAVAGRVQEDENPSPSPAPTQHQPARSPEPVAAPSAAPVMSSLPSTHPPAPQPSAQHKEQSPSDAVEYVALWGYQGQGADDLSFEQDDVILTHDVNEADDWWFGTHATTHQSGYFPKTYVERKSEDKPELSVPVRALYDYEGPSSEGCLTFTAGTELTVIDKDLGDWWRARLHDGTVGLVPSNYVEEI